jgi:hypothetical protein
LRFRRLGIIAGLIIVAVVTHRLILHLRVFGPFGQNKTTHIIHSISGLVFDIVGPILLILWGGLLLLILW